MGETADHQNVKRSDPLPRRYYPYPVFEISEAKKLYKFPPQHPIINTVYAMSDVFPDLYVQLNHFHDYFKDLKHASFIELCANLGAKEIYLEYGEVNGDSFDFKAGATFAQRNSLFRA